MSRYLLDTCTFIWMDMQSTERLGAGARAILSGGPDLVLSDVSIWELCIKSGIGRLDLSTSVEDLVEAHADRGMSLLPIHRAHIFRMSTLPLHHRDPFDRLLAAQALCEGLPLLSADKALDVYGVRRIWE